MSDNDPPLYLIDTSAWPGADELRAQQDRDRAEARRRYGDYLAALFADRGIADPATLAEAALDALTVHLRISDGTECRCGCHPRLPDSAHHDFGFDCSCAHTAEHGRRLRQEAGAERARYRESPEGRAAAAAAAERNQRLRDWLAGPEGRGVTLSQWGGMFPEVWRGTVDGHSFNFSERDGQWYLELDLHPSGRFVDRVTGIGSDGTMQTTREETDEGNVIASGTTDAVGYGANLTERAAFIVGIIRDHLARESCDVHRGGLAQLRTNMPAPLRFCPACGIALD